VREIVWIRGDHGGRVLGGDHRHHRVGDVRAAGKAAQPARAPGDLAVQRHLTASIEEPGEVRLPGPVAVDLDEELLSVARRLERAKLVPESRLEQALLDAGSLLIELHPLLTTDRKLATAVAGLPGVQVVGLA